MYYSNDFHSFPYYREIDSVNAQIVNRVLDGIKAEATAIEFYSRLSEIAPTTEAKADILHALDDERIHLQKFTELYLRLTGRQPSYQIVPITFNSFQEGAREAYRTELEAYEEYRNAYLMTQDPIIRDVFLRAFTDEIEHAIRFSQAIVTR
ncbi:ferritin family protein [Sporolactobacillus spathodeae]|uniref:Rubrerythrin n=1 Tax=Sporolactobacillus spathodeae TaxID=1465502 RepID=A0ABS2Q701_9BACL|nr:ferritin-like domain-containing protein [Sporolactobacillus spathodeae]MBM7657095.1 rubrerythrin [Sporolactobacillus spathodeae]